MAIINYHCAKGRLIGEDTSGTRTDYMSDALGSVTGTVNSSQAVVNTYRYKPFGELLAKTGSGADPKFMWNGSTQSRRTGLGFSDQYNRARHYGTRQGQWTTVDPVWPSEWAFVYVRQNPGTLRDPSGYIPDFIGCQDPGDEPKQGDRLSDCCKRLNGIDKGKVIACMSRTGFGIPKFDPHDVGWFLDQVIDRCTKGGAKNSVCIRCATPDSVPNWPKDCPENPCRDKNTWGYSYPSPGIVVPGDGGPNIDRCGLEVYGGADCTGAYRGTNGTPCSCSIIMCSAAFTNRHQNPCAVLYHEIAHCSGLGHLGGEVPVPGINMSRPLDFIYKLGCCICNAVLGDGNCGEECKRVELRGVL